MPSWSRHWQELLPGDALTLRQKLAYQHKAACLRMLEEMSQQGLLDLFCLDESRVTVQPVVPYAWQFKDEGVFRPSGTGGPVAPEAASTAGRCSAATCAATSRRPKAPSTAPLSNVQERLDALSLQLQKLTVVLDNASAHVASCVQQRREVWQQRGLVLFYLPTYSPHLNIVEVLWHHLKYFWLRPQDYLQEQTLFYQTR